MRYTHEFKLKCVDLYRQGMYPETPEGLTDRIFHNKVREWVRIEESCGIETLKYKNQNKEWTTDVSQFNFPWGKCYISPILDMNTNEIISYDLSLSPNIEQISRMLTKAFNRFPHVEGLIFHSDQGWQYQHEYFRSELKKHGIIQSMSRKGNCYDNSIMETFFARLKNELYYGYELCYGSFEEFSITMEEYINYYNNERIQAKTKWMPPAKYREASMCA